MVREYETGFIWRRGYLVVDERDHPTVGTHVPEHWVVERIGNLLVLRDPLLDWATAGRTVGLLGIVVDPYEEVSDADAIARRLARSAASGVGTLIADIEPLGGRFVVIAQCGAGDSSEVVVVPDATASRTVTYATGPSAEGSGTIVSSHPSLLARVLGTGRSAEAERIIGHPSYRNAGTKVHPGRMTTHDGVLHVPANCLLHLDGARIERIFPTVERRPRELDDVAAELAHVLTVQARMVAERGAPCLSLTAGIDSRIALAATRPVASAFTYFTVDTARPLRQPDLDVVVAGHLAGRFDLDHLVLRTADVDRATPAWEAFSAERLESLGTTTGKAVWTALLAASPLRDRLQVRSNLGEIATGFYRGRPVERPGPADLARTWTGRAIGADPAVIAAFGEFIDSTRFDDVVDAGYDAYDFFYWEHRMTNWHGLQLLDSDVAFDSLSLFNSRRLLTALLSLEQSRRFDASAFRAAGDRMWPAVFGIPINPPHVPDPLPRETTVAVLRKQLRAGPRNGTAVRIDRRTATCRIKPRRRSSEPHRWGGCRLDLRTPAAWVFLDLDVADPATLDRLEVVARAADGSTCGRWEVADVGDAGRHRSAEWLLAGRDSTVWKWSGDDLEAPGSEIAAIEVVGHLRTGATAEFRIHRVETG